MTKKGKQKAQYGCQQNLIANCPIDTQTTLFDVLGFIGSEANKLTNCGIYYARQLWFKEWEKLSKFDLVEEYKTNLHYQALYSQAAQQTLLTVYESFKSYHELKALFEAGQLENKPKLPNYRTKDGLAVVSYPSQALKLKDGLIRVPLGNAVKRWFGLDCFYVPMPTNLNFDDLKELRILPRNRCFYVEFVYPAVVLPLKLNKENALGIDAGVSNWLTCVSNVGTSFIIDGHKVKSLNQWYNKRISTLKEGKPQGFWNDELAHITEKRNRQMRDAVNKAARLVINHCLEHNIGTIVFGWNKSVKIQVNLGKKNNQNFVQLPTARLKNRIEQLCKQYGIQIVETEESYTSQASFLDNDFLPTYGEKPEKWKFSGKRVHRGMFKTASGKIINADCNGAANILRKVETQLDLDLARVCRADLTLPQRIFLWKKTVKKRKGVALAHPVATV